jgi:DUF2934 family protein
MNGLAPTGPTRAGAVTVAQGVALATRLAAAGGDLLLAYLRIASRVMEDLGYWASRPRSTPSVASGADAVDTQPIPPDRIRSRAYELYERRGYVPGDPLDDWRQAEAELRTADSAGMRPTG